MALTPVEIYSLYDERRKRLAPAHARAIEVRDTVNGDLILAVPEIAGYDKPAVANLMQQGLEQMAMRISSTIPNVYCPSVKIEKNAEEQARDRRHVILGWWEENRFILKQQKRARHYLAYATSPVVIRPDFKRGIPVWQVRDPLTCYPPEMDVDELVPPDCIFTYRLSAAKVRRQWPDAWNQLNARQKIGQDQPVTVLEYVDDRELVLCASLGQPDTTVELERTVNRTGRPLAVVPGKVSLDRAQGHFDGLLGHYGLQAQMMATIVHGVQRSIWPETWVVSGAGQQAQIVTTADPIQGVIGQIEGGEIATVRSDPSAAAMMLVDRLERAQRLEGGIPAEFGGEATTNVRTGRRGDAILSAVTDFPIQAAHELFQETLAEENRAAIAVDRAYFSGRKTIVTATKGEVSYSTDLWETDRNYVRYSRAGADLNRLIIEGGQRMGAGTMSKRGFMEIDPMVEDPEQMLDEIVAERLDEALLSAVQNRAASDPMFVKPLAQLVADVRANRKELAEAYLEADERLREEQAAAQQGELPVEASMPGLGQPEIPAAIPAPEPSLENLNDLMMTLSGPHRLAG